MASVSDRPASPDLPPVPRRAAALRSTLRRWHIWLGWLVGLPMLLWTLSGVVMVARPIEEVRGTALLAEPAVIALATPPVVPRIAGRPVAALHLEARAPGPRWVVEFADGGKRLADPASGALLPPYGAAEAMREVAVRYRGRARMVGAARTDPRNPPLDLRRPVAAWAVSMSDGTRFYVEAASGEIIARRTRFWRFYDLMWGLHIMDPRTREDTHNPLIIGFGIAALVTTIFALMLLPLSSRRGRRRPTRLG